MRYYYPKLNAEMPDSHDVMTLTPSEALPPLADHLTECGLSCYLDRSDAQQKLCSWGLGGSRCRRAPRNTASVERRTDPGSRKGRTQSGDQPGAEEPQNCLLYTSPSPRDG